MTNHVTKSGKSVTAEVKKAFIDNSRDKKSRFCHGFCRIIIFNRIENRYNRQHRTSAIIFNCKLQGLI